MPARRLARVSLLGSVMSLTESEIEKYRMSHVQIQEKVGVAGVDSPKPNDLLYRLVVEKVFYIAGLAIGSRPETITQQDYVQSEPDPLRNHVAEIVEQWNKYNSEFNFKLIKI